MYGSACRPWSKPRPRAVSRFGLSSSWMRPTKSLMRASVESVVSQNGYLSCGGRHAAMPGCASATDANIALGRPGRPIGRPGGRRRTLRLGGARAREIQQIATFALNDPTRLGPARRPQCRRPSGVLGRRHVVGRAQKPVPSEGRPGRPPPFSPPSPRGFLRRPRPPPSPPPPLSSRTKIERPSSS